MIEEYRISPQAYLQRCRDRLLDGSRESLFYAAFELRCCVESRLSEYFEHYRPLSKKKFQPYKIGENQKIVSGIVKGDFITEITFEFPDGTTIKQYHTPVPVKLQLYVKRSIDGLRHCQPQFRRSSDEWWNTTRNELLEAYRMAWIACRGEMPLPPLWNSKSRKTHPLIISATDENEAQVSRFPSLISVEMGMNVNYLESPPSSWQCDL